MNVSIVIATRNKAAFLRRTLQSIVRQALPAGTEILVVDDGSIDETPAVCAALPVRYVRMPDRVPDGNNGAVYNLGYRMATGDVILTTSDDVEHRTPDLVDALVARLTPTTFVGPAVYDVDGAGQFRSTICGPRRPQRANLYCTAIWRADLYAVGGHDEEFAGPGYNDTWLAECLRRLQRTFQGCFDLEAWHVDHPRAPLGSRRPYRWKLTESMAGRHPWTARAGAWRTTDALS